MTDHGEHSAIEVVDVGGIPAFLTVRPGRTEAGLVFGVGAADEALPDRGLTHLCEHLALADLGRRDHPFNGFVTWNSTHFVATGTTPQVLDFFGELASRLKSIPTARLATERSILRAEAMAKQTTILDTLLWHRYGACSYGRVAYREFALHDATADRVDEWVAQKLHSCPVAMWVSGEDPTALASEVTLGIPRREAMQQRDMVERLSTPSSVSDNVLGPNVSLLTERSPAAIAAIALLRDRIEDTVRTEKGDAYAVAMSYEPISGSCAHAHIGVDALPDRRHRAVLDFYTLVRDFEANGPTQAEVERYRRAAEQFWTADSANWAAEAARAHVLGNALDPHRVLDEVRRLSAETIANAFSEAIESALFVVPPGCKPNSAFPINRRDPAPVIGGTGFDPIKGFDKTEHVRVDVEACSWSRGSDLRVTIGRADHQALLCWSDGSRTIIGADGSMLRLVPQHWQGGRRMIELVDRAFSDERRVEMGEAIGETAPPKKSRWLRRPGLGLGSIVAVGLAVGVGSLAGFTSDGERTTVPPNRIDELIDELDLDLTSIAPGPSQAESVARYVESLPTRIPGPLSDVTCSSFRVSGQRRVTACRGVDLDGKLQTFDVVALADGSYVIEFSD